MQTYRYVIVGGGMVAGYAAQELVERGLQPGELAIISADIDPPYERPPLSKGFLAGRDELESVFINDEAFYRDHGIEVRLEAVVEQVDAVQRRLELAPGDDVEYGEQLLIATGAEVRTLRGPGSELEGIFYLRSLADSKRIRAAADEAKRAVVIGGGFIGMEVAAVLSSRGLEVTLVFPEDRVWSRFFTPEMSSFFQGYYEKRGVRILPGVMVRGFEGREGRLTGVEADPGGVLPADIAIAGIGVAPVTAFLRGSGIELDDGVVVDEFLATNIPGVRAAGDVANYLDVLFGKRRRVEHWDNAVEQGRYAARVMRGETEPFVHVPYFFSDVFDLSYEFWGDADGTDSVEYRGDVEAGAFSAWWLREGTVRAGFVMNRPDEERDAAPELIRRMAPLPARF